MATGTLLRASGELPRVSDVGGPESLEGLWCLGPSWSTFGFVTLRCYARDARDDAAVVSDVLSRAAETRIGS